jgi:hypothetical protein
VAAGGAFSVSTPRATWAASSAFAGARNNKRQIYHEGFNTKREEPTFTGPAWGFAVQGLNNTKKGKTLHNGLCTHLLPPSLRLISVTNRFSRGAQNAGRCSSSSVRGESARAQPAFLPCTLADIRFLPQRNLHFCRGRNHGRERLSKASSTRGMCLLCSAFTEGKKRVPAIRLR